MLVNLTNTLLEFERKSILAAAMAQESTGAPVGFHPGRDSESPFEIMRIFTEAGGNAKKAVVGHLESNYFMIFCIKFTLFRVSGTINDLGLLAEFTTEFGSYCQFDLFGIENSYYQIKPSIDFYSDAQRISLIESLIEDGFEDKILISQDIHTKHRTVSNFLQRF